jgi:hypothetical protein
MPEYTLLPKVQKGWSAAEAPARVEVENRPALNPQQLDGKYTAKIDGDSDDRTISCGTTENWVTAGRAVAFKNTGTVPLRIFWP